MKKLIILFVFFLLALTGCVSALTSPAVEEPDSRFFDVHEETPVVEVAVEAPGPVPFAVLYSALDIQGAMYEPTDGAYLGAWLRPDMTKTAFEETVGNKHAVFVLEMTIGDAFPATWILQSLAAQAAPLIILQLPCDDDFPLEELANFAYELGTYNLPAFIVFNPHTPESNITPEDYVLLFRYVRIIFRTYAPMAAFVWHGYSNEATPESPFYPGHDVVDWVSIKMLAPQDSDGFIVDIPSQLKPFYLSFQQDKPIIILPIGVGHFSRRDYVYRVSQAAAEIKRVYEAIRDTFPRVHMVIYASHNISTPDGDDFSLTKEEALITAYNTAISDSHFITRLESGRIDSHVWMRSPLHGYYYNGEIFIDREILTTRRHLPIPSATTEINGRIFVNTASVNNMKIATDHTRRVIYVHPGQ